MWRPDEPRHRSSVRHLYARHAEAAERAGWSVERDVRWSSVDLAKARRRPDILAALRAAAFVESCHPLHIGRLIAVAWDDVDACVVLAAAMYESVRHFHAIRTYLEAVGHEPRITDQELVQIRRPLATDGDRADLLPRLVELMLSAHLASYFYRRLGEQACDPVLAEMLALIAADEVRHAQSTSDLLAKRIAADADRVVPRVLDAAVRFRHVGEATVGTVPVALPGDPLAIRTFARRIERLCGVRFVDHLKTTLVD